MKPQEGLKTVDFVILVVFAVLALLIAAGRMLHYMTDTGDIVEQVGDGTSVLPPAPMPFARKSKGDPHASPDAPKPEEKTQGTDHKRQVTDK